MKATVIIETLQKLLDAEWATPDLEVNIWDENRGEIWDIDVVHSDGPDHVMLTLGREVTT